LINQFRNTNNSSLGSASSSNKFYFDHINSNQPTWCRLWRWPLPCYHIVSKFSDILPWRIYIFVYMSPSFIESSQFQFWYPSGKLHCLQFDPRFTSRSDKAELLFSASGDHWFLKQKLITSPLIALLLIKEMIYVGNGFTVVRKVDWKMLPSTAMWGVLTDFKGLT